MTDKMSPEARKRYQRVQESIEAMLAEEETVSLTKTEYDRLVADSEYLEWLRTAPQQAVDTFRGLW